jgi:hypothetical protein
VLGAGATGISGFLVYIRTAPGDTLHALKSWQRRKQFARVLGRACAFDLPRPAKSRFGRA